MSETVAMYTPWLVIGFLIWLFLYVDKKKTEKEVRRKFDSGIADGGAYSSGGSGGGRSIGAMIRNTDVPEDTRRQMLITELSHKGHRVVMQDKGVVQAAHKAKFSLLLFLLLCLLWVVPGVLYLIWYMTQKEKLETYIIPPMDVSGD